MDSVWCSVYRFLGVEQVFAYGSPPARGMTENSSALNWPVKRLCVPVTRLW